jgi:two-component system response regulator AtoC
MLLERAPGEPVFSEAEQSPLLALAFVACLHAPPASVVTAPAPLVLPQHDPEARRERHGLRLLHEGIVGESPCLIAALRRLEKALPSRKHVLLLGETGSGKEEMARALVKDGSSKGWKFVKVVVAGLTATLVESELFGHVKGAFTDAIRDKVGLVGGGEKTVLFFDEIGDLPLAIQVKLYQLMETGEYRRVGDVEIRKAVVRVVVATSCDLERLIAAGQFKPDLYFRFARKVVRVPALRDRLDDLPRLLAAFFGEEARRFTPEALATMAAYSWPGNVREFRDVLDDLLDQHDGPIGSKELLDELAYRPKIPGPAALSPRTALANLKNLPDSEKLRAIEAELAGNGGDLGAIRKAADYSDEGWVKLLIRLGMRPPRRREGG